MVLCGEAPGGALVFPGIGFTAMVMFYIKVCIGRNSNALARTFFNLVFQLRE